MKRAPLTDGTWFDVDLAEKWEEGTYFDGSNHVSMAAGSQWAHECLYRSRKCSENDIPIRRKAKTWILHSWSNFQGSRETYARLTCEQAALWFVRNQLDAPDELSELVDELEV